MAATLVMLLVTFSPLVNEPSYSSWPSPASSQQAIQILRINPLLLPTIPPILHHLDGLRRRDSNVNEIDAEAIVILVT